MLRFNIDNYKIIDNDENFDIFSFNNIFSFIDLSSMDSINSSCLYFNNYDDTVKESNNISKDNKILFLIKSEKSTYEVINKNTEILPEFYSMNKISDKILNDEIKNKLKDTEIEKTTEYKYLETLNKKLKKLQKDNHSNNTNLKNENIIKKKRGRAPLSNRPEHNRMSADNIIKKIKCILMKNIFTFLNKILKSTTKDVQILKLDYKYCNQLNRSVEFKLLKMKLKQLMSLDISPKYSKLQKYYNKEIIEKIINKDKSVIDETKENDYKTLMFVLNLTFREWLDLLLGKKNFQDLAYYYGYNGFINFDLINNNFVGINQILNKFEENENYFSRLVFYFYNYERWFYLKAGRITKKKTK